MPQTCYLRVLPFDKTKGHLAKTVTVGGQKFIGREDNSPVSKWYSIPVETGKALQPLLQDSGQPFFEVIYDKATWERVVKYELATQLAGPEAAAVASLLISVVPQATPVKGSGSAFESSFGKIQATEVPVQNAVQSFIAVSPVAAPVEESEEVPDTIVEDRFESDDEVSASDGLDDMPKAQLLRTAKDRDIPVSSQLTRTEIIEKLRAAK
jgi:hypothetical protein